MPGIRRVVFLSHTSELGDGALAAELGPRVGRAGGAAAARELAAESANLTAALAAGWSG